MSPHPKRIYSFGVFRLDPAERLLLREGKPISITPKVFDLLLVLVEHRGRLLEKDELMGAVWPDTIVEEANLSANISILRKALGDSVSGQSMIETVPKRGYRFIAPVKEEQGEIGRSVEDQSSASQSERATTPKFAFLGRERFARNSRRLFPVMFCLLIAAAAIVYWRNARGGSTTSNLEAYQLYLRGRYFWNRRTEEGFKKALDYFQQAIRKDPNYALAHVGLSDCYLGLSFYSYLPPHQAMPQARAEALKALEIDSSLAEGHISLAHVKTNYEWDWPAAEREFQLASRLAPDYATGHQWYAAHFLTPLGKMDTAVREMKLAQEREPLSLVMNSFLASTFYFSHEYDQAIEQADKTLELDPNFCVGHWHLGLAYLQKKRLGDAISQLHQAFVLSGGSLLMKASLGQAYAAANNRAEAENILNELEAFAQQRYAPASEIAAIYVGLGERELAFHWLKKALEERAFHLIYIKVRPEFDPLRSDPRFAELLRRIGLEK